MLNVYTVHFVGGTDELMSIGINSHIHSFACSENIYLATSTFQGTSTDREQNRQRPCPHGDYILLKHVVWSGGVWSWGGGQIGNKRSQCNVVTPRKEVCAGYYQNGNERPNPTEDMQIWGRTAWWV